MRADVIQHQLALHALHYVDTYIKPKLEENNCEDIQKLCNKLAQSFMFNTITHYTAYHTSSKNHNDPLNVVAKTLQRSMKEALNSALATDETIQTTLKPSQAHNKKISDFIKEDPSNIKLRGDRQKGGRWAFCFDAENVTSALFNELVLPYFKHELPDNNFPPVVGLNTPIIVTNNKPIDANETDKFLTHSAPASLWHRFQNKVANNRCSVPVAMLTFATSFAAIALLASGVFTLPTLALAITCYAIAGLASASASAVILADCTSSGSRLTA